MAREKFYSMYAKAKDVNGVEHTVTVVGKLEQYKVSDEEIEEFPTVNDYGKEGQGFIVTPFKRTVRRLRLAYSICHPNDEFNEEVGTEIAKKRIEHDDFIGELYSPNCTMLNDDQCQLSVFGELNYIVKNIDKYLPLDEEDEVENYEGFDDEGEGTDYVGEPYEEPHAFTEGTTQDFDDMVADIENTRGDRPYAPNIDDLPDLV